MCQVFVQGCRRLGDLLKGSSGNRARGHPGTIGTMGSARTPATQHPAPEGSPQSNPSIPWLGLGSAAAMVGIALGVYNPFVAVTLTAKGFDVATIGILAAVAAVGFVVGTARLGPARGHAPRPATGPRHRRRRGWRHPRLDLAPGPGSVVAALFLGGTLFVTAWLSLVDAILVNAVNDSRRYARLRLISSFTYAVSALAGGIIYSSTGFTWSLLLVGVGGVGLALVALRLPDVARAKPEAGAGQAPALSSTLTAPLRLLRGTPGLPLALLAIALAFLGYMAGNTFMGLYLLELGGNPADVGLASAISAAIEVPAILMAGVVAQRFGIRSLFVLAAGFAAVAVAGWAIAPGIPFVLASRLLAGVGYGGMLVAGVMAVRFFLPPERQGDRAGPVPGDLFRRLGRDRQRRGRSAARHHRVPGPVRRLRAGRPRRHRHRLAGTPGRGRVVDARRCPPRVRDRRLILRRKPPTGSLTNRG